MNCHSPKWPHGFKPDLVDNLGYGERALALAGKISAIIPHLGVIKGSFYNPAYCQLEVVIESEPRHNASRPMETPSDVEQWKEKNRQLEEEAVQLKDTRELETGKEPVMSRSQVTPKIKVLMKQWWL